MKSTEIGSFPVALALRGRAVLVVGGAEEAVQKIPKLLAAGALVTVVAPHLDAALVPLVRRQAVRWFAREFSAGDVRGAQVVLLTLLDEPLAQTLRGLANTHHFLLCALDQPAYSDFYLVATLTRGPVQLAISTGGRAPLLARRLRQALEAALDTRFSEFAEGFAALRARVRTLSKSARTEVLERALAGFAMEVTLRYPESDGRAGLPPPQEARER